MKPEIKARWVAALRSGEYRQILGRLKDTTGYCCLGVLCDLHAKEVNNRWDYEKSQEYTYLDGSVAFIPNEVAKWAGMVQTMGVLVTDLVFNGCSYITLAQLNDNGADFNFIADVIENNEIL